MSKGLPLDLVDKYNKLVKKIKMNKSIIISYSGGVDSALLAKIAYDELGGSAIAVFLDSETVPRFELDCAKQLADEIGIKFQTLRVDQLSDENFTKNDIKRCYYCRKLMAEKLKSFGHDNGITTIAAGAQETDLLDYRPGIKAFNDAGIWHPYIEFKITKEDIRKLAKFLKLNVSEKPSMACLSSRIQYGEKIAKDSLEMIEQAEDFLRKLGFHQYRARINDKTIRIEILIDEFEKLLENRRSIITKMKELGFIYVTLDLEGFRSGSGNEVLNQKKGSNTDIS